MTLDMRATIKAQQKIREKSDLAVLAESYVSLRRRFEILRLEAERLLESETTLLEKKNWLDGKLAFTRTQLREVEEADRVRRQQLEYAVSEVGKLRKSNSRLRAQVKRLKEGKAK